VNHVTLHGVMHASFHESDCSCCPLQAASGASAAGAGADGLADLSGAGLAADGTGGYSAADAESLAAGSRVTAAEHRAAKLGSNGGSAAASAGDADSAELLGDGVTASRSDSKSSGRTEDITSDSRVQKASVAGAQQELGALTA
jgi:hypothetical protein